MTDQPHNILLLTAMVSEMLPILQALDLSSRDIDKTSQLNEHFQITPSVVGVGTKFASEHTKKLIEKHAPDLIVLLGISGSLDPHLKSGDLVIPDSFITDNKDPVVLPEAARNKRVIQNFQTIDALKEAISITASQLVTTPEYKLHLYEHKLAQIVDMESYPVARSAREYSIPAIVIRSISDTSDDHLLPEASNWVDQKTGNQKPIAAFFHLLTHPTVLPEMLYMKKTFEIATQSLAIAAKQLFSNLPIKEDDQTCDEE
ncbi:hypothetical protein JD969_20495 [Planctomycetota bacterium]|nr:hypothetical protein JD969_20495 [Planctomycetota bacterium]